MFTTRSFEHLEATRRLRYPNIMRRFLFIMSVFTVMAMAQTPSTVPDLAQLQQMAARFAPTPLHVDQSALSAGDKAALAKLIEAARRLGYTQFAASAASRRRRTES